MSHSFTKLFSSITESTIWCEPAGTRLVWITMLAKADRVGRVFASIPGLARVANVTLAECEQAITTLLSPDPYSRTPDNDGVRIEPIDGGWRLLNHAKYRALRDEESVREQKREHMRRVRAEQQENGLHCGNGNSTKECGGVNAEAEADTERAEAKTGARAAPLVLPEWLPADAWQDWHGYRNSRKGWTHKARLLSLRTLTQLWAQGHDPRAVIEQSIERGWTGLFPVREDRARAGPGQQLGKTAQGINALEEMKRGIRDRMAGAGDPDGSAETHLSLAGPHAGR